MIRRGSHLRPPGGYRIGIDARFYALGGAGLARYTQELIEHLVGERSPHRFVIFLRREDLPHFRIKSPQVEVRTTTVKHYTFGEQVRFGRELNQADLDLVHFTNFNWPISYRRPFVISIHDLTLLHFAGRSMFSAAKIAPMRLVMSQGAKRGQAVLTYSEYQKGLITDEFGVNPDKVRVIYEAADEEFKPLPAREVNAFRRRHNLTLPFIMHTGQWRQHKNVVRLLKAFRIVRDRMECKLVLVGKIDPAFPIIPETIAKLGLMHDVILTDFVEDKDLPLYYNAADLFAFPSLAEGFGLPPLEAMACGTTVASSSAPCMPEILGGAAAYFDPFDTGAMAEALLELLSDKKLRADYRDKGLKQVSKYSWKRTARQTLDVYQHAIAALRQT